MTVSRDEVFEILRGVVPRLEEALPGWSVRPNITGTGAVGLYLGGPAIYRDGEPLAGVNAEGEPVVRHLCGTIQTADRGLPQELGQVRYQYILGVSVAEHESEYPELADLVSVGGAELGSCAEGPGDAGGVRGPRGAVHQPRRVRARPPRPG